MEELAQKDGPKGLAEFIAAKYFDAFIMKAKKYIGDIKDYDSHDIATEAFYRLIKNEYSTLQKIKRKNGHLRGLFSKIIKATAIDMYRKRKNALKHSDLTNFEKTYQDLGIEIYLDLKQSLAKMEEKRPLLYRTFVKVYMEGENGPAAAEEIGITSEALRQRLCSARRWLAKELSEYDLT